MQRLISSIVIVLLALTLCAAKEYEIEFNKYIEKGQLSQAAKCLEDWSKATPDDSELFPARFNLLLNESRQSMLVLSDEKPENGEDYYSIADSTGNAVGAIFGSTSWNDSIFNLAIKTIEQGIKKHPRRLDFRFGAAGVYMMRENFDRAADYITAAIEYNDKNAGNWLWDNNEKIEDPSAFNDIVQDYLAEMSEAQNYGPIERIANMMLARFPNDFKLINIAGALAFDRGDYHAALELFNKALALQPGDSLILLNIAYMYCCLEQYDKAISTYRIVADDSNVDDESKQYALDAIDKLSSK